MDIAALESTPMGEKQNGRYGRSAETGANDVVVDGVATDADQQGGRELWTNQAEFILSCVGFAVGLGNIWRFPYLCYKNGGGAFLIPYAICLLFVGIPVFFLEVGLGQYMKMGGYGSWNVSPLFKGIGVATAVVVFHLNLYYIVILAWDVYYLAMSFTTVLPWSHCNNTWNTERCSTDGRHNNAIINVAENYSIFNSSLSNVSFTDGTLTNGSFTTDIGIGNTSTGSNLTTVDPVIEFWERKILRISNGIDEPGELVWQLALSLLFVWIVNYFCIWKGIKWTGKVVYFTATFPYVILTILLIRGVTLDGAVDGIIFYLKPDFTKILEAQVWIDGGTQILFSYAIGLGAMISLGSYNRFHNNFYKDCLFIAGINSCTSLYGGFAVFSVLGFMAKQQGVPISEVAESGPGLAFIAYPKAAAEMPLSALWAILFFVVIFFLGLDSQFVGVEAFITTFLDWFPKLGTPKNRPVTVAVYCIVSYILGLCMVTQGGMYVFQLFDYYACSGFVLLLICFFESITIGWVYGPRRFYDNIEMMIGYRINPIFAVFWTFFTPLVTVGIFIYSLISYSTPVYNRVYSYPAWAIAFGFYLALSSLICIPAVAVYRVIVTPGSLRQRLRILTTPILKPYQIPSKWRQSSDYNWYLKN